MISKYLFQIEYQQAQKWEILINSGADNPRPTEKILSKFKHIFMWPSNYHSFIMIRQYLLKLECEQPLK